VDGSLYYLSINFGNGFVSRVQFNNPTNPAPIIATEPNTDSAIALDSVSSMRDPFPLTTRFNFSADGRTRLSLFVMNLDLQPGENVTARLEDASLKTYSLTVEFAGKVPNFDLLTQVIVRLPNDTPSGQTLFVSVTLRGQTSNKARIRMQ
jgi:hypothetical protein